ncbi:GNAT family N-acetyltransferase [Phenylobacterium montanum]|uniref:GNAT family N-acetyltransferase n=1 Tax=Phenylobacterium montanum TaxID=2823693 RepID=A0A975IUB1_9CAUL|nr:GNAT family N-acetyltransferase [Caulobacter sp. S6]QUD87570.1 GNAT family N-acetyltransferase [Caulobacter sp. S6]
MTVTVRPLEPGDHAAWLTLWRGYLAFYQADIPDEITALTWDRLLDPTQAMFGAAAVSQGVVVGFVHWLTHPSTWARGPYVYLEDLFVGPAIRGGGAGRTLIEHVYGWAAQAGSPQVYWLTQETNAVARLLYDRIAERSGFIHYAKTIGS